MRDIIIIAGAALALAACGSEQAANETVQVNESAEVQAIDGNDTTAIDAATNDAANMAEDADLDLNLLDNGLDGNASGNEAVGDRSANAVE